MQPDINLFDFVSIIALQSSLESNIGFFSSTVMLVKPVQPENAPIPISSTFFESSILVKFLHSEKAFSPITTTLSGSSIFFKPVQPLNAS